MLPTFEREQIEQAKRIMKPFVLRRLKCDVLQDLPKKIDHVIKVAMAPTQKEQYENLVAAYQNAKVITTPISYYSFVSGWPKRLIFDRSKRIIRLTVSVS